MSHSSKCRHGGLNWDAWLRYVFVEHVLFYAWYTTIYDKWLVCICPTSYTYCIIMKSLMQHWSVTRGSLGIQHPWSWVGRQVEQLIMLDDVLLINHIFVLCHCHRTIMCLAASDTSMQWQVRCACVCCTHSCVHFRDKWELGLLEHLIVEHDFCGAFKHSVDTCQQICNDICCPSKVPCVIAHIDDAVLRPDRVCPSHRFCIIICMCQHRVPVHIASSTVWDIIGLIAFVQYQNTHVEYLIVHKMWDMYMI